MSGYENSPACQLLASRCALCSRPLVDAASVECGMGPICRNNAGLSGSDPSDARARANQIVNQAARERTISPEQMSELCDLGFYRLASLLAERLSELCMIRIEVADGVVSVRAPYLADATGDWRAIPGRRWNKEEKANEVPERSKAALWRLLRRHYAGALLATGSNVIEIPLL